MKVLDALDIETVLINNYNRQVSMRNEKRAYVAPMVEEFRRGTPLALLATMSLDGGIGGFEPGDSTNIGEDIWDDYIENP